MLLVVQLFFGVVFGGYPISDPSASSIGGKISPYNLIDTDPSCWHIGICPMFTPGHSLSSFPNSEEKFQHILSNLHRMFANQSLDTPLGHWFYGANEAGGETFFCQQGCVYCGTTHPNRKPLYWYSDANQMARFKQWDENTCDQSWYNEPGQNAHSTCKWANTSLPAWRGFINGVLTQQYQSQSISYKTGTNRCALFGATSNPSSSPTNPAPFSDDCTFSARAGKFCHDTKDRCWFETEGICGGNTCLFDPHCEPIFANKYDYAGKGFVENMNGVGAVYSRYTKEIYYPLPIGTHYDQRWKIHPNDRSQIDKYFVLMLEYFDYNKTQTPQNCWALYNDIYTDMTVYLSNHPYDGGSYSPGTYDNNDFSVIFKSNYDYSASRDCSPYAFLCKTSLGNFFRLPQETNYYFGTEWMEWVWSDFKNDYGLQCKENHYYYHQTQGWTVNGGPTLTKSDIWYYQDTINYGQCIGCQYIQILDCWETCIRSNFQSSQCQCSSTPTHSTTDIPTTKSPTTKAPTTKAPTTKAPTTKAPTTKAPTTKAPTTKAPTTKAPTITATTTNIPTTKSPTTKAPTTKAPTTKAPTTTAPTTKAPTTQSPTTKAPTTKSPTTKAPTTQTPTTQSPTTQSPTTAVPTDNTLIPTLITTSPSYITLSPTFISSAPSSSPTHLTISPSSSPTDITLLPTPSPTAPGQTCNVVTWSYRWSRIGSWNEITMGSTYREVAEELFIDNHPLCGIYNSETMEYYYYFKWWGLSRPNKKKLDIWLHVCCGDGMTFGPNYNIPDGIENNNMYQQNAVLIDKYSDQGFETEDTSWTEPNKFGIKQYIVFGIIGLIIICCCGLCIYFIKYYFNKKKGRVEFGSSDRVNYLSSNFPSKSRGSKKNLTNNIQMGGMSNFKPGPKHVSLPSHGRDSTDGSTDGSNRYQGQFIHHHYNQKSDDHDTTNLAPPIQLMGHAVMPSQSLDDDNDDNDDNDDENNHNISGLPPPSTSDIHQLNDQDIADAFQ